MQMQERFDIVVSGGSFTGLALARALSLGLDGSLQIAIIDRRLAPAAASQRPSPRAFSVTAASRRLLEAIGVWGALAAEAQPVTTIEITDSALDAAIRPVLLTYDNLLDDGEPASSIVPDAAIISALRSGLEDVPGITLVPDTEVTGFSAGPDDAVLSCSDGVTRTADLVVGAEGRLSSTREAAGIKLVTWDYGQTGICTRISHEEPHGGRAIQHFLPAGPFAILPLPGNRCCITWSETSASARRILALSDEAFLAEVETRLGGRLGAVALEGPRASWPLALHMARALVAPRFALIGDAARGVHPIAGQGLNLGLRDVGALSEVITDSVRLGFAPSHDLARYERWRRFDGAMSAAAYDGLNRFFSNDWGPLRRLREAGLGLVDRLPLAKSLLVKEAAGLTGDVPKLLRGEWL